MYTFIFLPFGLLKCLSQSVDVYHGSIKVKRGTVTQLAPQHKMVNPLGFFYNSTYLSSDVTKCYIYYQYGGRENSTVVSVSVYQAGGLGSLPSRSACHRKVEFYHTKAVHVLLCLCNNACKRSLAICRKSRALCPVSRLLSVPI